MGNSGCRTERDRKEKEKGYTSCAALCLCRDVVFLSVSLGNRDRKGIPLEGVYLFLYILCSPVLVQPYCWDGGQYK